MLDILAITGPIYLTILVGFFSVRIGWFTKADMRLFGKFVIQLAIPALLFNALAQRTLGEVLQPGYLLAYASGSLLLLVSAVWFGRRRLGKSRSGSAYYAMGMTCSNSGYIGYPVLMLTLGPIAGVVLALNLVVESFLKIPLLLALAESDPGPDGQRLSGRALLAQSVRRLLANPMILAIIAGASFALFGWRLPEPLARTVNLFSMSAGVLALFVIGGTLVDLKVRGMRAEVAQIAVGKLILHPLLVGAALLALPWLGVQLDPVLRAAALLSAAMPMLGIYTILAQKHGHEEVAAAALLATTVVSFITLSALLWVLRVTPGWLG